MASKTKRPELILSNEEAEQLTKTSQSQTKPRREVERAKMLLLYSNRESISSIKKSLGVSRPSIYKCIDKALAIGIENGLKDKYHCPKPSMIDESAKAWVINIACTKPKDHGYAAEVWSHNKLAEHVRKLAVQEGHPCLVKAAKATVQRILKEHSLQPHKVEYYLEKRDPEFERKMKEVLMIYKEVLMQNKQSSLEMPQTITVSVDEKPGVQALQTVSPDRPPIPEKGYGKNQRDYEYKRLGTISILAGLDLNTGRVIAQVHDRHRSCEFIQLLKEMDAHYPEDCTMRVILDNHSAHISKETMAYLATVPNRFQYIHTPKHGSWLNLVESLFSKMARTFLKHIRVESKEELKERILKWVAEVNEAPVVFSWKKFEIGNVNV